MLKVGLDFSLRIGLRDEASGDVLRLFNPHLMVHIGSHQFIHQFAQALFIGNLKQLYDGLCSCRIPTEQTPSWMTEVLHRTIEGSIDSIYKLNFWVSGGEFLVTVLLSSWTFHWEILVTFIYWINNIPRGYKSSNQFC